MSERNDRRAQERTPAHIFLVFLRLGLTSFGGPVAHIGYFHEECVRRRRWLDERAFGDLVALAQFLPGPASSQVGLGLGLIRGGLAGAAAAWIGFTLPSAILMAVFGWGILEGGDLLGEGWLSGLKVVAVAIVALAVWNMGQALAPDRQRRTLALLSAVVVLMVPGSVGQIAAILGGAAVGLALFRDGEVGAGPAIDITVPRPLAVAMLCLFAGLMIVLPVMAAGGGEPVRVADAFYRAGALVFGGGHVVLPLLESQVVPPGWIDRDHFLAGYGAAQALPGPLFTFAAYLGVVMDVPPGGVAGAVLAILMIFLPSALLIVGCLPFWSRLRGLSPVRAAMAGVNAAVVGLLLAALYHPVATSALHRPADAALAIGAFLALALWRWPPWLVVLLCALGGGAIAYA